MAGKFLVRAAIIDTVKSEQCANARRRRGLTRHPISTHPCGCGCGAFHVIRTERTIPTPAECDELLRADNRQRKPGRPHARPAWPPAD